MHLTLRRVHFYLTDNISSKVILFAFWLAAEIERDLIATRTREALATKKEQGMVLGHRPGDCPKIQMLMESKDDILRLRQDGIKITRLCEIYGVSRGTMTKFLDRVIKA